MAELLLERGIAVCYSTINRWVVKFSPLLADEFKKRHWKPGSRWRMDQTYIKVCGQWKYLYRAVDSDGNTIDFLLTAKRDCKAALRFLERACRSSGKPELINIDKSGVSLAAIVSDVSACVSDLGLC